MKKIVSAIIMILLVASTLTFSAFAMNTDEGIAPCYNNVYGTNCSFDIFDGGEAEIYVNYNSDTGVVSNATIEIKLEKKFLFWWNEKDSWTLESTSANFSRIINTTVNSGKYRIEVTYTINGTGGTDVITKTLEAEY